VGTELPSRAKTTSRIQRAIQLQAAALTILRLRGSFEEMQGLDGKVLKAEFDSFHLSLRTPFSRMPEPTQSFKHAAAVLGRSYTSSRYGLDVWAPRKVLNVEWNHEDRLEIVSFRRGIWEDLLIAEAARTGAWPS
jgi:hypothetical protein